MEKENDVLAALARFYEAEARYSSTGAPTDRQALLSTLHPQVVLYQPSSLPYGGEWRGREAFGQWLDAFTQTWTDICPTDAVTYPCGEDALFCTVTMRACARTSGVRIEMPMCQVIRTADGLPIEWRNFAWDTVEMMAALSSGQRPAGGG